MPKSKIPWTDYSLNPIRGVCEGGCEYCYGKAQYRRFKWDPTIRLDMSVFESLKHIKPGSKVFLCSTHDLFGHWISWVWQQAILDKVREYKDITFIILTKNPIDAVKWNFPSNVWLGVSVEGMEQLWRLRVLIQPEVRASIKLVSFEPLHSDITGVDVLLSHLDWIIVGAETGRRPEKITPERKWLLNVANAARRLEVPLFVKNNITEVMAKKSAYIPMLFRSNEFPERGETECQ